MTSDSFPSKSESETSESGSDFATRSNSEVSKPSHSRDLETRTQLPSKEASVDAVTRSKPVCAYQAGDWIGRYEVVRELGTGGFGHVVLANDPKLRRQVAIKIPREDRLADRLENFLEEGRSVAKLDHPSIVKVFDIEETESGLPYAVMEYVKGPTLRELIRSEGITFNRSVGFLIQIADALTYAHGQTVIHRDLKPANVIISQEDSGAKLMDFGMALHELSPEEFLTKRPEGTPPYMAPEQIRGENHRLDRRTDIWGFGVLMYVMLTGQKPFHSEDFGELITQICLEEPVQPRMVNPGVPIELERICLRCLEKLMSSRYQSASEVVEELRMFRRSIVKETADASLDHTGVLPDIPLSQSKVQNPASSTIETGSGISETIRIVPKGLRSFDHQDAEFFLDLIPGPRGRAGIPESIQFWINCLLNSKIDAVPVGLIYGPSGCGKSSFAKAGLVPRLADHVKSIFIEATPTGTETQLMSRIANVAPQVVRESGSLATLFSRIRRGQMMTGQKLLIVFDQFEQWLHHNTDFADQPLVHALRQCDGENLCGLLLVRDDFWMGASEFMGQLDMKVQEGVNSLGIPQFDRRHARRVMTAYGQATEAIADPPTPDQSDFIAKAIAQLDEHGRIIPLHLALFADVAESDEWGQAELNRVGGWKGVAIHFLQKTFDDVRQSHLEPICRKVLMSLLPDETSQIKGARRSLDELLTATQLAPSSDRLNQAIELLDRGMHIVTPTQVELNGQVVTMYQLAHDFLVEPVRKWLLQKEKESWRGRSNLRMAELASQWQFKKEKRYLPGPVEFAGMAMAVSPAMSTSSQKAFLGASYRYYGSRLAALAVGLFAIAATVFFLNGASNFAIAKARFESLITAPAAAVSSRLDVLEQFNDRHVMNLVEGDLPDSSIGNTDFRLRQLFAVSRLCEPEQVPYVELFSYMEDATSGHCRNFVEAFGRIADSSQRTVLLDYLDEEFNQTTSASLRNRIAVVELFLGESRQAEGILAISRNPEVREYFIDEYPYWNGGLLETVRILDSKLAPHLKTGIAKSLGNVATSDFSTSEVNELLRVARKMFEVGETPGIHSMGEFLLRKFGERPVPHEKLAAANGWAVHVIEDEPVTFAEVNPQMVDVGAGISVSHDQFLPKARGMQMMDQRFLIATKEVRARLFYKFVESLDVEDKTRIFFDQHVQKQYLERDLPVLDVDWTVACEFCNWMSRANGRTEVYTPLPQKPYWTANADANGYRLPTALEWDAANRVGTTSRFFFGQKPGRLERYSIVGSELFLADNLYAAERGQKMPNDYGVFDLIGNVSEWNENLYGREFRESGREQESGTRTSRGGYALHSQQWFESGALLDEEIERENSLLTYPGIRIVVND